jgi:hypothetical protein
MKRYVAALLVVLGVVGVVGVVAVGRGFADDENASRAKCSDATLHGTYLLAQDGVDITGKEQVPFAIAGYDVFDGNGHFKTVASVNFNGEITRKDTLTGTYSIKANCIGTGTYKGGAQADMFIAPDGSKFTFVQVNPSQQVTSGLEERVTAKRVAP